MNTAAGRHVIGISGATGDSVSFVVEAAEH
jgi:hypothetical protein